MSHNNHSRTVLAGDIPEQFHHLPTTMAIQCGGGFVSENHSRMIGQCSGERQLASLLRINTPTLVDGVIDCRHHEEVVQCPTTVG